MSDQIKAIEASSGEIRAALMTVLATLPVGADFHFYWQDGVQHMSAKFGAEPEMVVRLNRRPDGVGVPSPVLH